MSTKHTPGPWRAVIGDDAPFRLDSEDEYELAVVEHQIFDAIEIMTPPVDSDSLHEHRGNARLIAAAPELLEACHAFVEAYEKSLQLEKTDVALRMAKAAIAKAEGGAS